PGVLPARLVSTGKRRRSAKQRDELASPHGLPSVRGITPYHIVCKNAALCITAKLIVKWQGWVRSGHTGLLAECRVFPQKGTFEAWVCTSRCAVPGTA